MSTPLPLPAIRNDVDAGAAGPLFGEKASTPFIFVAGNRPEDGASSPAKVPTLTLRWESARPVREAELKRVDYRGY